MIIKDVKIPNDILTKTDIYSLFCEAPLSSLTTDIKMDVSHKRKRENEDIIEHKSKKATNILTPYIERLRPRRTDKNNKVLVEYENKRKNKRILLTPFAKKLFDTLYSDDKYKFFKSEQYEIETKQIEINELQKELDDTDYIDELPGTIGFYMESYAALTLTCPVCNKKTLYKYNNQNMPVIDLVCINDEHDINKGVRFFQVKTKNNNSLFAGTKYFDIDKNYAYIGSIKFGYNSHIISAMDFDKTTLIGYLFISISSFNDNYKITDAQWILPNLSIKKDKCYYYYTYDTIRKKYIINWDNELIQKIKIIIPNIVSIYNIINENPIINPLASKSIIKKNIDIPVVRKLDFE
jgi:hypothetical protein